MNSRQEPSNHFPRVEKLVEIGSAAKRDIGDIHLTRYARRFANRRKYKED
jgi:hypothetical protein